MKTTSCYAILLCCSLYTMCPGEQPKEGAGEAAVRRVFVCQISHDAGRGAKVIESAEAYAALRKNVSEIVFPEPGVRRVESRMLRELGEFDFAKSRLVLIWNTSMADNIRVLSADADEIRVQSEPTFSAAPEGSATLLALEVPRGEKPPRVTWLCAVPEERRGDPEGELLPREGS